MMHRGLLGSVIVFALIGGTTAVMAQSATPPDLKGTWKGSAKAVSVGGLAYRTIPDINVPQFSNEPLDIVFTITDQQDERFAGTSTVGANKEIIIGSLMPPNFTNGIALDDDGHISIVVQDESTISVCYDHLYPKNKVVSCYTMTRQ